MFLSVHQKRTHYNDISNISNDNDLNKIKTGGQYAINNLFITLLLNLYSPVQM